MSRTLDRMKKQIDAMFKMHSFGGASSGLVSPKALAGKVYETFSLAHVIRELRRHEGITAHLSGGNKAYLKASPGRVDLAFPHFRLYRRHDHVANLFTDVEFTTLSCERFKSGIISCHGDYHELDIAVLEPSCRGYPTADEIWLAAECKHRPFEKNLWREVLGLRREMSLLRPDRVRTRFSTWPSGAIRAEPPVPILVFSTDPRISRFNDPATAFEIGLVHLPV